MNKIKIFKLDVKFNSKGNIVKLLEASKINKFGELYISNIKKKKIKGWKLHSKMNMNLFVLSGKIKFVFFNQVNKKFRIIIISASDKKRIFVRKNTWFAFQNISNINAQILNFADVKHSVKESKNVNLNFFEYNWKKKI